MAEELLQAVKPRTSKIPVDPEEARFELLLSIHKNRRVQRERELAITHLEKLIKRAEREGWREISTPYLPGFDQNFRRPMVTIDEIKGEFEKLKREFDATEMVIEAMKKMLSEIPCRIAI